MLRTHCLFRRLGLLILVTGSGWFPSPGWARAAAELPAVLHYDLRLHLFPATGRLAAEARLVIGNPTRMPIAQVPLVLYRLFEVTEVTAADGQRLRFQQTVERFREPDRFQVLFVQVTLARPLRPGDSTVVRLRYGGPYLGASEVWPYLHDRVSEDFTLIRPDAAGYPMVSDLDRLAAGPSRQFTWTLEVSVPGDYRVASGGT
ncbi:MAG: hypothetical protein HYW52_10925, partial [Gemmatimonadetes bacterium]|nr:hypothetical protein [Gemmatimonadota bacterium]